ncbi:MAG TPA: glycosyltransferase family 2 protein [Candidatus Xenobia bacterium]|jgi:glycosyltransferase involved in cell wall biosynthesis
MRVFAIIPAYNEAARIAPVIAGTRPFVETVLVVNDGSKDDTEKVAGEAGATVLNQPRNMGKGAALQAGFDWCMAQGAEAIATLDADGQHRPEDIPRLLEPLQDPAVGGVVGSRRAESSRMPFIRRMTNYFTSWLLSQVAGQRMEDTQSGYRVYRPQLLRECLVASVRFEAESEVLIRAARRGWRIAWVPIEAIYLEGRVSHIHPIRDSIRFFQMVWRVWRES